MGTPPANQFISDADGVTRWRAEIDGITVHRVFKGVLVTVREGDATIRLTIAPEQAKHLGSLLLEACA